MTQLALMQVFTILPICLSPVIGIVNQLVHFAEVSELAGINFRHGGTYITSDNFPAQTNRCQDGVTCIASRHLEDACTIRQNQLLIATPPLYHDMVIVIECLNINAGTIDCLIVK